MKNFSVAIFVMMTLSSVASYAGDGEAIFKGKKCTICHKVEGKGVGPSLKEIRKSYGDDVKALVNFFKGKAGARVQPSKYSRMKIQLKKLKNLKDDQLKSLAGYVLGKTK